MRKKHHPLFALFGILCLLFLFSGCSSVSTVAKLCAADAAVFEQTPISLTYTYAEGEPADKTVEITDTEAVAEILALLLTTEVKSKGCAVDMYMLKYEEYTFDFSDETYSFCIIPDSYVSYEGLYYEITTGNLGKIRAIIADYQEENDIEPVSPWYGKDAVLDTSFYDNGDEAPAYTEITLSCSKGTLTGVLEGAYDILSVEKQADCYIVSYTYGDYYIHEAERQSKITVVNGELVIESVNQ